MRVLVAGRFADVSRQGGATWAILQWALGLQRLGHEVALVEPLDAPDDVRRYREDVLAAFGVGDVVAGAELLVNVSGLLRDEALLERIPVRLYLDLDPAFTQLWHEQGVDMGFERHTHFATVGLGLGRPGCDIPTCGREWIQTLPPVVLERWPVAEEIRWDGFTTVGNWRSYGPIEYGGVRHGQRAHSVRAVIDLPARTDQPLMPAFALHPDETTDIAALRAHGWRLLDPLAVAATPAAFQGFVGSSKGEIGIAKEGYVVSRSGWFSDRSACYLASGRPVVAQDTGFARSVPTGEGLLAFSTAGEAAAAIEDVAGDYEHHRRAARAFAEEHLDSDVVLMRLLQCL